VKYACIYVSFVLLNYIIDEVARKHQTTLNFFQT